MSQVRSQSFVEREEQFEDRWTSFGKHTGLLKIYKRLPAKKLKQFEIFKDYDDAFLEKISPDVCVAVWDKQKVLFEEGSYIDLAFFVVKGYVNIYIQKQQNGSLQPIFDKNRTKTYSSTASNKKHLNKTVYQTQIKQIKRNRKITFLSSMDIDLPWGDVLNLGPGEIFGEIGASVGWPQSVTAQTASECVLVQIRMPALTAMKRKSKSLKNRLNEIYIERSLSAQLKNTPLFRECSDRFIEHFKKKVELQSFKRDEVITGEGDPADSVYLVRSGFVKLSQKFGDGEIVVNYLSKGMILGEIELMMRHENWLHTASSVENTELVKISHSDFEELLDKYPKIQNQLWDSSATRLKESAYSKRNISRSEFISTALDKGLVEGNSILVIDLDVCTRCDDCVKGCADTHSGLPKFQREGEKYHNLLITRACYQCQDPVCLLGCPTGAIRRAGVGDVVEIDDELCIGCKACFQKCPYNAITMVESGQYWDYQIAKPKHIHSEIEEVATKCDLCYNTGHEPACVSHCPHGCAVRLNSVESFAGLLSKSERKLKSGRSFELKKFVQSPAWFCGFLLSTTICLSVFLLNHLISEIQSGNVWGLSYGVAAAILMIGMALYGVRRRLMKLASKHGWGKSYTWVQFHIYGGVLFLLLVFMHTGFRLPNGALYWWLWSLSIWVTISGLLGVFLQKWVPKILSSALSIEVIYERIPELISEIKKNADNLIAECTQPVKDFYRKQIAASLRKPKAQFIYYVDITGGIQERINQFEFLKKILSDEEKEKLNQLAVLYKSKLEIDAHYTLQKALRSWLYIHLPASIVLLILVAIHLFAVFYY